MVEEARRSEIQAGEFDASLVQIADRDWDIISSSPQINDSRERCYFIGDLAVLDPQRTISIPTQNDWDWFIERTDWLKEQEGAGGAVRHDLIKEMAKVDPEKAGRGFRSGELDNWERVMRRILKGEEDEGLFPSSIQELLIYSDYEGAKKIFDDYSETAWNSEKRYLAWLRHESPAHVFTLLAALSEIDQEQTVSLMEKSDWRLAQEGLSYYRTGAAKNGYRIRPLITHLAAVKNLTPFFEQLFQQESPSPLIGETSKE